METKEKPVVLVSGAAGGIGSATCQLFHDRGWVVVGVDQEDGNNVVAVHKFLKGDFSDPGFSRKVFKTIKSEFGSLNSIINNAAVQICKNLLETSLWEWDRMMNVNVRTILLSSQYGFEMLQQTKGSIVNVSSVHAVATSVGLGAYASSKGAVDALTRSLALELAPHSIRVNAVMPGAIETGMLRDSIMRSREEGEDEIEGLSALARKIPLGRIGQPREIAETILFLAGEAGSFYITGQSIVVDGGALVHLSTE